VVGGFVTTMSWASVKLRVWGGLDHSVCVILHHLLGLARRMLRQYGDRLADLLLQQVRV
jgi:hypothetical protein